MSVTPTSCIEFPTPHMAALFPTVRAELKHLHKLIATARATVQERSALTGHVKRLVWFGHALEVAEPALRFFLAHPTQRLSIFLSRTAAEALTRAEWLKEHALPLSFASDSSADYAACCERIETWLKDWHLAVKLTSVDVDLDSKLPETLH